MYKVIHICIRAKRPIRPDLIAVAYYEVTRSVSTLPSPVWMGCSSIAKLTQEGGNLIKWLGDWI